MKKLNILFIIITTIVTFSSVNAFKDFTPYVQGDGRDAQGKNMLHRLAEECEVAEAFIKAKDDFGSKHFNNTETITIRLTIDSYVESFAQEDENGENPIDIASRKVYETRNVSCEKMLLSLLIDKAKMQHQQSMGKGNTVLLGKQITNFDK